MTSQCINHPPPRWRQFLCGTLIGLSFLLTVAETESGAAAELGPPSKLLQNLGYTMVPLRRTGENHLFVFGRVDNRKRSCLIDTGWSFTTISTNAAGALADTNRLDRLMLGKVEVTNVPVVVRNLRVNGQPTSYQAVLGCDFLLHHQAIIDCGNDKLYLRPGDSNREDLTKLEALLEPAGWIGIKLRRRTPAALTCEAWIKGEATEWLVDSGAMWSCLDKQFATTSGLRTAPSPNRMTGPATRRQRSYAVADLKSWQVGSEPMPERTVAVLDLTAWGLGPNGDLFPDVTGILGGAELKATGALIDCGSLTLWLRKSR